MFDTRRMTSQEIIKSMKDARIFIAYPAFIESFERAFGEHIFDLSKTYENNLYPDPKLMKNKLLIFSGGEDIHPKMYNEKITYSEGINGHRDAIESDVLRRCIEFEIKILGVCRGHQLINVLHGAKLVQDIGVQLGIYHGFEHPLEEKEPDSLISCFDTVNSMHHQSVMRNRIPGSVVTSTHKGVIESVESERIVTTQFHPEFLRNEESFEFFERIKKWAF